MEIEIQQIEEKLGRIKREMLGNETLRILRSVEVFKLIRKRAIIEFEHIAAMGYKYLQNILPECSFCIIGKYRVHEHNEPKKEQDLYRYRYVMVVRRAIYKDIVMIYGNTNYYIKAHIIRMGVYPKVDDYVLYDKGVVVPLLWSAPRRISISTPRPELIRRSSISGFETFFKNIPVDLYKVYNYIREKGICV